MTGKSMSNNLFESLTEYGESDYYPLHMPGHKRNPFASFDPYKIDITEIEGFDNLHDPKGLIKEVQERAAMVFGADKTYLLVNGVTGGILAAISAVTDPGETILMARNCHRAVYGGAITTDLNVKYIFPGTAEGLMGGIAPADVEEALSKDPGIKAVIITSPTYEGFVSDIREIARITHDHGVVLIVDEAHGAHFSFGRTFPESALSFADIVLHGAHKTLPAFTQSALLHVNGDKVDRDRLERFLRLYQTSSPSYILMAGLDRCISFLENEGRERFAEYEKLIKEIRKELGGLKAFRIADESFIGRAGISGIDPGKLVIMPSASYMTGVELSDRLRKDHHLECEMADAHHIIAMTSVMDSREGLKRLTAALNKMDKGAEYNSIDTGSEIIYPVVKMKMREAYGSRCRYVDIKEAEGMVSSDFINIYPPGIPLAAPGEVITGRIIDRINEYKASGLDVKGLEKERGTLIKVVI